MPLLLELRQRLSERSGCVESVDLHPAEPLALAALDDGTACIWDWARQAAVERLEVSDSPLRCARFVPRESWAVAAADDMIVRVFDYSVPELLHEFDAHDDYIRCLAVHPSLPYLLSCSDDSSVKMWDWSQDWQCCQTFQGHTHNVMMCQWEAEASEAFASCSLDMSLKVWRIDQEPDAPPAAVATLLGHEAGVCCLAFAPKLAGARLASGSEDLTVRVWDYVEEQCIRTLSGHSCAIAAVAFHPTQPLLLTGSGDRTVQFWSTETWQVEDTWDRSLDRVHCLAVAPAAAAGPGAPAALAVAVGHARGLAVAELRAERAVEFALHALREGPEGLEVHYAPAGASAGRVLALRVDADQRLAGLRAQLAEHLEVPERKLKLFLPGGRLLLDADGLTPLDQLLSSDYADA